MYKILCVLLILITVFSVDVVSQIKSKTFRLEGEINSKRRKLKGEREKIVILYDVI